MEARIVSDLRDRFLRANQQKFIELTNNNRYWGITFVAKQICQLLLRKLNHDETPASFETFSNIESFLINLDGGDNYYNNLFSKSGIIVDLDSNASTKPFSHSVGTVYNELFFEKHTHQNLHIVYGFIADQIRNEIGTQLALSGDLERYEQWVLLYEFVQTSNSFKIYSAWEEILPLSTLLQEIPKLAKAPANAKLSELAWLGFSSRDADEKAANYLAHIAKLSTSSPLKYVQDSTWESDQVHLTGNLNLQSWLLHKAGLPHWVRFLDSLRFPILQDHLFLFIKDFEDYLGIVHAIVNAEDLITPKAYLLIIALENYFECCNRSLSALDGISEERMSSVENQKPYILEAQALKEKIIKETIPTSFNAILNFTQPSSAIDGQFIAIYDWMNSHGKLYLYLQHHQSQADLIDLLNDLYEAKLKENKADYKSIVDSLKPNQINWECLRKLVGFALSNSSDIDLRDKIYEKYVAFIAKPDFFYNLSHTEFRVAINDAYHFSQLISSYETPFEKWSSLYAANHTFCQGWVTNIWGKSQSYKEAYLLCVGAGIAYWHFANEQSGAGETIMEKVLSTVISQLRSRLEHSGSAEYSGALKFIAIVVGRFCTKESDNFVLTITDGIDSLKLILISVYELGQYHKTYIPSAIVKSAVLARIEDEFWMIEQKYKNIPNGEYEFYSKLRNEVEQFMK